MYIEKLKIHKVAGLDSIPAELLKQGGTELKTRIQKLTLILLMLRIW